MNIELYADLFLFFVIYAFLGWCCEVVFAVTKDGKFVNRGFLNGPWCPIYGFGVILVITVLWSIKDNFILLFIGSVILTSVLEFLTGFILEKFFRMRWWDYTNEHFNIKGYVCLKFSILWGLACLIVIDIVHPAISALVEIIPTDVKYIVSIMLFTAFTADVIVTAIGIKHTMRYIKLLNRTAESLRRVSDVIGENLSDNTLNILEKGDELSGELKEKGNALKESIDELRVNLDEKYEKLHLDIEKQRDSVQKRLGEIKNKRPYTANRIFKAFPELSKPERNFLRISRKVNKNLKGGYYENKFEKRVSERRASRASRVSNEKTNK